MEEIKLKKALSFEDGKILSRINIKGKQKTFFGDDIKKKNGNFK